MSVTRLLAYHFFFKCKIKSETTGKRTEANFLKEKENRNGDDWNWRSFPAN
jgi:hypothetical protein